MNLAARMVEILRADPTARALTVLDASGAAVDTLSRGELLAEAAAWHERLHEHGVGAGARVAVALPRTRALPAVHIAALACGATIVPINTSLPAREREEVLAGAAPDVVIDETEARKMLELARNAGLLDGYLENQVFSPAVVRGREIVWARGAALSGPPYLARAAEEHSGPHMPWFWEGTLQGGGVLNDMMCHSVEESPVSC